MKTAPRESSPSSDVFGDAARLARSTDQWRSVGGVLAVGVLLVPAGATLFAALQAIVQPFAVDYGEAVMYGHAMRLIQGEPLYQPITTPPYTVLSYTPLYYWATAALQAFFGPGFGPGRTLSLIAGVATAATIAVVAARRSNYAWAGAFAGLLFLAFAFPGGVPWLGVFRVDMLGIALSIGAIAVLSFAHGNKGLVLAAVLAGLALLCKQTLVAALLAGALWHLPNIRRAAAFLALGLLTVGIPCIVLELATHVFIQNTVLANLNPLDLTLGASLVREFLAWQWLPLLLAGVYLVMGQPWRSRDARLLALYWGISVLPMFGMVKVGANHNYWIEFAAATAILAGCGAASLVRLPDLGKARAAGAGLVLVVALAVGGPAAVLKAARSVRSDIQSVRATTPDVEFNALVERVRREPGAVLAQPADVVVLAGRAVLFDPLQYNMLLVAGQWRAEPLVAQICSGEIHLLITDYSLEEGAAIRFGGLSSWPHDVMAALQDTMGFDRMQANRYIYTVHPPTGGGCPGARLSGPASG